MSNLPPPPPPPPPGRTPGGRQQPGQQPPERGKQPFSGWPRWTLPVLIAVLVALFVLPRVWPSETGQKLTFSEFVTSVGNGDVATANLNNDTAVITGELSDGTPYRTTASRNWPEASDVEFLRSNGVDYDAFTPQSNWLLSWIGLLLPFILFLGFFVWMQRRAMGQAGSIMSVGKSRAKTFNPDKPSTTFADIAGYDGVKQEIREVVDFLRMPERFREIGARVPKGMLLVGPPGTGKTLFARAVAGEAGVGFLSVTGSDFMEMFVGVGASRVRDLFQQARKMGRAIIFIDEIDSIGRKRGAGLGGGHDEREQTLNQMLAEMDGFETSEGIVILAATNRPDILDPALLRPGRFDRQIAVDRPDLEGRYAILQVHARGKPIAEGVDLRAVARRTPGFTGADLANVLNEAALLTARMGGQLIDDDALDEAIDRVIAGPQKRTRVMDDQEKMITAYHEGGHALVAAALPGNDPVHKITIMPRGRALGYTMVLPDQEKYSTTRSQMLNQLAYMLGGRAAEELIFHDPTTGASNDIEKATTLARAMVTQYGMTERLGAIRYGQEQGEVFLGRDMGHARDYSEEVAAAIDEEVRSLIETAHQEAYDLLVMNRDVLDRLVLELLEKETLDKAEVEAVFTDLRLRSPRAAWTGSSLRKPDERGPIVVPAPASSNGVGHGHANGHTPAPAPAEGVVQRGDDSA